MDYTALSPDELVNLLADKHRRDDAIRSLVGGLTATELRRVKLTEAACQALVNGLKHPNPKVPWWCLQLFDHVGDERSVAYILPLLDDPVPRVRKHVLHALECERCKQSPQTAEAIQSVLAEHAARCTGREQSQLSLAEGQVLRAGESGGCAVGSGSVS